MSLPHNPKLLTGADLDAGLEKLRGQDKTIVFTNGCFDILHPGHVDLLARARAQGDVLVLGLNSDASVRRIKAPNAGQLTRRAGPARPLNAMEARAFVLAGLASVDIVAPFEDDTPLALIRQVRPDVLVKGGDWPVEAIVGREVVQARGGRVLSLPLLPGYSTTTLVEYICG